MIWNYIGVFSLWAFVEILTTLVCLFAKHFWAATFVHRRIFRTLSGIWASEFWENISQLKAVDYVYGMPCLGCLEGFWICLCCSFKCFTDSVVCNFFLKCLQLKLIQLLVLWIFKNFSIWIMPFLTIRHAPISVRNITFLKNSFRCFKCQWSDINVYFSK